LTFDDDCSIDHCCEQSDTKNTVRWKVMFDLRNKKKKNDVRKTL